MWHPEWPIGEQGFWLYDVTVPRRIRIQRGDILYGTGDYEDPPEYREDREVTWFYVWHESPPGSMRHPSGGGAFLSVADAIDHLQRICGNTVQWE